MSVRTDGGQGQSGTIHFSFALVIFLIAMTIFFLVTTMSQTLEQCSKIFRQRRAPLHHLPGRRMPDLQALRMQRLASEAAGPFGERT